MFMRNIRWSPADTSAARRIRKLVILRHYNDVMSVMASKITGVSIVYSTVCSGADQRKYHSSASLAFVRGIHRWPVTSPHKWPVTWKIFPCDAVNMNVVIHILSMILTGCNATHRYAKRGIQSDAWSNDVAPTHDDVIKWKHFPRTGWPLVRGIHRSPVNSLHKGQ